MPRYHGHRGAIYLGDGTTVATNTNDCKSYELNMPSDKSKVTAFEDAHHIYAKGKMDPKGKISAFFDVANVAKLFSAADADETGVPFYLYPKRTVSSRYFYGTAWVDPTLRGTVEGAVEVEIDLTPAAADWGRKLA